MEYYVIIEETVSEKFKINANSREEAINIAKEKYDMGELVLEPGNLMLKQICIESLDGSEVSEWMEF